MLPTVVLRPFHYRGQEVIGFDLLLNNTLEKEARKLRGIKWCGEKGMWYIPLSREHYEGAQAFFKERFSFDATQLRQYLAQRKASAALIQKQKVSKARAQLLLDFPLCTENLEAFQQFQNLLLLKGYSENTLRTVSPAASSAQQQAGIIPEKRAPSVLSALVDAKKGLFRAACAHGGQCPGVLLRAGKRQGKRVL
jgi:hypothetical protein